MSTKKVLVVEDDEAIRQSLVQLLEEEGYEVSSAANGQLALDYLSAASALPNLILLDLMMPVKDGFEFCAEKENDPRIAGIPVIIMSAYGHLEEKQLATKARAFIKKPVISIDDVSLLVRKHCV